MASAPRARLPPVATFAGKAEATAQKLRGGYYTPEALARLLAGWTAAAGPRILEPSCGDGAILRHLPPGAHVTAVELEAAEAARAREHAPAATVLDGDFFAWFGPHAHGAFDGVVGNPPFIRFQHWSEPARSLALAAMRAAGLRPTKLTNAWVPFVVAASLALREGGRLGLVLPAELLQVTYAAELRAFLVDAFAELTAVTFRRLVFAGTLQEVVLLLGQRGAGPARIRAVEVDDAESLPDLETLAALPHAPALRHDSEKWTKYLLDPAGIRALRRARAHPGVRALGELGEVDVGVVTGRNRFFVLRPSAVAAHALDGHARPLVSRSAQLRGVRFSASDLGELERDDARCRLLVVDGEHRLDGDERLRAYVAAGEAEGVHTGYKCAIRRRWWVVPSVWTPDAFLLRQIHDHPRIVANETPATATDTIHRVRLRKGTPPAALAAASINSMTFAFAEVMGRSYGGGVLELEPREAEGLPFPEPARLTTRDVDAVDKAVRAGRLIDALDRVDRRLLIDGLGLEPTQVSALRAVWERLRDRRRGRG